MSNIKQLIKQDKAAARRLQQYSDSLAAMNRAIAQACGVPADVQSKPKTKSLTRYENQIHR